MYVYYFKKKKKLSENLSKEDDREISEEEDTERWMAKNKDVRKHKSMPLIFTALLWRKGNKKDRKDKSSWGNNNIK